MIFLLFILSVFHNQVLPQAPSFQPDTLRKDGLNVYMQVSDYIRREIPFINYVRDIKDAGVYIISTSQRTGSGGIEYSYFLVGQHQYTGMNDTLTIVTSPDETSDMIREKQVNTLKMGLMRYVAKTPLAKYMRISFSEPLSETVSSDKWDSWVFKSSISGYLNGQKTYKSNYFAGTLSASRITEDRKINFYARYYKNSSKFIINDVTTIRSSNDSKYISALVVKSLSDHWSIGGSTKTGSSSYDNERSQLSLMPGD